MLTKTGKKWQWFRGQWNGLDATADGEGIFGTGACVASGRRLKTLRSDANRPVGWESIGTEILVFATKARTLYSKMTDTAHAPEWP